MFDSVFDGRQSADNALVVGDLFVGVERDVEVDLVVVLLGGSSQWVGQCYGEHILGPAHACP